MFPFYPEYSGTGSRKTSNFEDLTILIFCRLVYDIPSHLNGLTAA